MSEEVRIMAEYVSQLMEFRKKLAESLEPYGVSRDDIMYGVDPMHLIHVEYSIRLDREKYPYAYITIPIELSYFDGMGGPEFFDDLIARVVKMFKSWVGE